MQVQVDSDCSDVSGGALRYGRAVRHYPLDWWDQNTVIQQLIDIRASARELPSIFNSEGAVWPRYAGLMKFKDGRPDGIIEQPPGPLPVNWKPIKVSRITVGSDGTCLSSFREQGKEKSKDQGEVIHGTGLCGFCGGEFKAKFSFIGADRVGRRRMISHGSLSLLKALSQRGPTA